MGIALGLLCLGYKVMETVGKKVVKLDFAKGFSAQFATALAINCGTIIGLPLSTTHCMVGALFGLILSQRFEVVKAVYPDEAPAEEESECPTPSAKIETLAHSSDASDTAYESSDKAEDDEITYDIKMNTRQPAVKTEKDAISGPLVIKILAWWLATVPVALVVSFGITTLIT